MNTTNCNAINVRR